MIKRISPPSMLTVFFALLLFFTGAAVFSQHVESSNEWVGVLKMPEGEVISQLAGSFHIFSGSELGSIADRVVVCNDGTSYWFDSGKTVQIRFSPEFPGSSGGLYIGMQRLEVISILGRPWKIQDESMFYNLPWAGFPVRTRLVFDGNALAELYLYRSDY